MRSLDLPRDAGAVYRKRAGVVSRHHDDTMMRDENRVKKCEKYLILLTKLAGVVQWQNGSFPSKKRPFNHDCKNPINIDEVTAPQAFPRYIRPVLLLNSQ
jgi:hypothetical protein